MYETDQPKGFSMSDSKVKKESTHKNRTSSLLQQKKELALETPKSLNSTQKPTRLFSLGNSDGKSLLLPISFERRDNQLYLNRAYPSPSQNYTTNITSNEMSKFQQVKLT